MRPGTKSPLLLIALIFLLQPLAKSQEQLGEVRSLLREAANLVPQLEDQQASAAANIAGLQVKAGDLEGALATAQALSDRPGQDLPFDIVASALVAQGNMPRALSLIRERIQGPSKTTAYQIISQQLAMKGDFASALEAARLMPPEDGQRTFVAALMRIYVSQWKADDRAGARQTLAEGLTVADKEARNPSGSKSTACDMYVEIARALDEAGNSAEALPLVDRIRGLVDEEADAGTKTNMLGELGYAQTAAGQYAEAIRTAEALPPGNARDAVVQGVAFAQMKHGDPEGGLETAAGLSYQPWHIGCVQMAASELAASHRYDRALALVDTLPEAKERAYALSMLALQEAEKNDKTAVFTVQLAWETALEAPETEHFVFENIAVTRGILGDLSGALAIVDRMDAKSRVWPLWNLGEIMVAAGHKDEALALARTQESPRAKVYGFLGIAKAMLDQIDAARKSAQSR